MQQDSSFNFEKQIQKFIQEQSLVQLHFKSDPDHFHIGIMISLGKGFFTFADIIPNKNYLGIYIYPIDNLNFIRMKSEYLVDFVKKINFNEIKQQVNKDIASLLKYSDKQGIEFLDFIDWLIAKRVAASFLLENNEIVEGLIIDYDDQNILLVQEEHSQAIINLEEINNIFVKSQSS